MAPTKHRRHQLIKQLNRIDPRAANYQHLKKLYRELTSKTPLVVGLTPSTEFYFRTRVNPKIKPSTVEEVHAPPPENVIGFQRCNPPGSPMFYASSKRITSLLECGVKLGDTIYLSQWMCREPMPVVRVFENEEEGASGLTLDVHEDATLSHMDTLLTRRVHDTFSEEYKFTAAITEVLTKPFTPNDEQNIRQDGTVGLRYPSVADIAGGYNTAMHPAFSRERLELLHVIEANIVEGSTYDVSIAVSDTAVKFNDGKIEWTGDRTKIPLPTANRKLVKFVSNGGNWCLLTRDNQATFEDIEMLLIE